MTEREMKREVKRDVMVQSKIQPFFEGMDSEINNKIKTAVVFVKESKMLSSCSDMKKIVYLD